MKQPPTSFARGCCRCLNERQNSDIHASGSFRINRFEHFKISFFSEIICFAICPLHISLKNWTCTSQSDFKVYCTVRFCRLQSQPAASGISLSTICTGVYSEPDQRNGTDQILYTGHILAGNRVSASENSISFMSCSEKKPGQIGF